MYNDIAHASLHSTATLRAAWDALKLTILKRAALTDDQQQIICDLRNAPNNPDIRRAFREAMPLTVARMPWLLSKIIVGSTFLRRYTGIAGANPVLHLAEKYIKRDIYKIDEALLGAKQHTFIPAVFDVFDAGLYRSQRVSYMHPDILPEQEFFIYFLGRLNALPTLVQSPRDERNAQPLPLGDIALAVGGTEGTMHQSSNVPNSGARSAFIRYGSGLSFHP